MAGPIEKGSRRRIDVMDIGVGVFLAAGIPLLAAFLFAFVKGEEAPAEEGPIVAPLEPGEVRDRLEYIRTLYQDNAYQFLVRAREADPMQQFDELRWAKTALHKVLSELGNLEYLVRDMGLATRYQDLLEEIAVLKRKAEDGIREVDQLDLHGVTRPGRG